MQRNVVNPNVDEHRHPRSPTLGKIKMIKKSRKFSDLYMYIHHR